MGYLCPRDKQLTIMRYIIENCANSTESAIRAQRAGAHRVELCAGMPEGGTTPSYGEIKTARASLSIGLHVIIRPRGGDFLYNDYEQSAMLHDIAMARELGVDGIVLGCLTAEGAVDIPLMRRLMAEAKGLSVTFHRAFDVCRDQRQALEEIIELGCDRILTSGGAPTAEQGIAQLAILVKQASERIIIMPGCGIGAHNIRQIAQATGARELHLSARSAVDSPMLYRHRGVSMGGTVVIDEYKRDLTDPDKLREAIAQLL